jgi:hypothetical protein
MTLELADKYDLKAGGKTQASKIFDRERERERGKIMSPPAAIGCDEAKATIVEIPFD